MESLGCRTLTLSSKRLHFSSSMKRASSYLVKHLYFQKARKISVAFIAFLVLLLLKMKRCLGNVASHDCRELQVFSRQQHWISKSATFVER